MLGKLYTFQKKSPEIFQSKIIIRTYNDGLESPRLHFILYNLHKNIGKDGIYFRRCFSQMVPLKKKLVLKKSINPGNTGYSEK